MPRILSPLRTPHSSPAALYHDFRKASVGGVNDLKKFRATWHNPETQSLFEKARENQKANPDMKANIDVQRYGWIEESESAGASGAGKASIDEGTTPEDTDGDVPGILAKFREAHPNFKVSLEADNHIINVRQFSAYSSLSFTSIGWLQDVYALHAVSHSPKQRRKRKE